MQISIKTLVNLHNVGIRYATEAFGEALGENYDNAEYEITQDDAEKVAAILDAKHQALPLPGDKDFFGNVITADEAMEWARISNDGGKAAMNIFHACGLDTPRNWRD